jgi:hypothetical protein
MILMFISDISKVRYNIRLTPIVSEQLFYSQSLPTTIITGNTAYEYSSWACHTSTTMEFFCLPLLTFKEHMHEERVEGINL